MTASIEALAANVGEALKQRGIKLVTAESCTGGGLSYWITSVPGSSDWFERGFVTYSDSSKVDMLGVNQQILTTHGAVSEATARAMAEGALQTCPGKMISIAITGIAGPGGGSPAKPVGTVWIASASALFPTEAQVAIFQGDRQSVRMQVIVKALERLIVILQAL